MPALWILAGCAILHREAPPPTLQLVVSSAHADVDTASDNRADVVPQLDLWPTLLADFRLGQCTQQAQVNRWATFYAEHGELTARILQRAAPWLVYIHQQTKKRQLPGEVVFLPAIESAFRPFAFSRGRAAGLWQFVPGTARHYGLRMNWWYDGRRDIRASTPAALAYVSQLGKRFQSNWLLALAAYNSGATRVAREARRTGKPLAQLLPWQLPLPRETRTYVPKLLGFACLMKDPSRYAWQRPPLLAVQPWQVVAIDGQIDLALVAKLTSIPEPDLRALNPGFNRWATAPGGPHDLIIPATHAAALSKALTQLPVGERVTWKRYRVRRGDNLKRLVRRFHSRIDAIQRSNGLGESSHIRAGDYLLIPQAPPANPAALTAALARIQPSTGGLEHDAMHSVVAGDSLWRIAQRYHVSIKQLQRWNGLGRNSKIRVGKDLVVLPANALAGNSLGASQRNKNLTYRVRRGDSLWTIARKFGVKGKQLSHWNGLDPRQVLHPGQSLRLIVDVTQPALLR